MNRIINAGSTSPIEHVNTHTFTINRSEFIPSEHENKVSVLKEDPIKHNEGKSVSVNINYVIENKDKTTQITVFRSKATYFVLLPFLFDAENVYLIIQDAVKEANRKLAEVRPPLRTPFDILDCPSQDNTDLRIDEWVADWNK